MSIDEKEVPEVVGYRSKRNGLVDEDAHVLHEAEPLMTVAQHERIVGAYRVALIQARSETPVMIDAQPARQVGGDERETAIAQFALTLPMTSESAAGGNTYDQELRRYYLLGWDDRAALATAAVVMPEPAAYRTIDEYGCCTLSVGKIHQDSRALVLADAVEYLNRRAIPEGLLEKAADLLKSYQQVIDGCHSSEIERFDYQPEVQGTADELRALLGKS